MKKKIRMLLSLMLASAIILSMATGVLATEQEHVHNWVLQEGGTRGHILKCDGCGQTKLEDHTVDSSEICTVCGVYDHTHNWQCESANSQYHKLVCSGCGEKKTATHSFDGQTCTVCGYTKHEHIWEYSGDNYDHSHGLRCTECDSTGMEDHIYGSDGKCTVCGQPYPHEHHWEWNGEQFQSGYHVLGCTCGETKVEEHYEVWDRVTRDDNFHGIVCNVCGKSSIGVHWYDPNYVQGDRCIMCGYEKVTHAWQYNNYFDSDGHDMVCQDCDSFRSERHSADSSGKCTVCGYQIHDAAEPETNPIETKPAETNPIESKPIETEPAESESVETAPTESEAIETAPTESEPVETEPTESEPVETEPAETTPAESETMPENAANEDSQRSSTLGVWITAVIVAAGGLGAAVFIWKKKSS